MLHRHTAGSGVSAKFLHRPARSLRRTISLLSTFGAVAGVQLQTSRSIKPRERDLGDLRLFFGSVFNEANEPSSTCRLRFKLQVEASTPPKGYKYSRSAQFGKVRAGRPSPRRRGKAALVVNTRLASYRD